MTVACPMCGLDAKVTADVSDWLAGYDELRRKRVEACTYGCLIELIRRFGLEGRAS